jgi:phosphinothricin acetyltransferase
MMIRDATPDDAQRLAEIYNYYILNSTATFEEDPLTEGQMADRIEAVTKTYPWLVAERDGEVAGYAYASQFKSRCAYRKTVETSIYFDRGHTSKGMGARLYETLLARIGLLGFHTAIGMLALPNAQSVGLHEKLGFSRVGELSEVGYKFGKYIDVAYYQKLL